MTSNKKSRRKFLKNTALASSLFIVPRHVLGGNGYTAPSDKLNLAGIGLHGKGPVFHDGLTDRRSVLEERRGRFFQGYLPRGCLSLRHVYHLRLRLLVVRK